MPTQLDLIYELLLKMQPPTEYGVQNGHGFITDGDGLPIRFNNKRAADYFVAHHPQRDTLMVAKYE